LKSLACYFAIFLAVDGDGPLAMQICGARAAKGTLRSSRRSMGTALFNIAQHNLNGARNFSTMSHVRTPRFIYVRLTSPRVL